MDEFDNPFLKFERFHGTHQTHAKTESLYTICLAQYDFSYGFDQTFHSKV